MKKADNFKKHYNSNNDNLIKSDLCETLSELWTLRKNNDERIEAFGYERWRVQKKISSETRETIRGV